MTITNARRRTDVRKAFAATLITASFGLAATVSPAADGVAGRLETPQRTVQYGDLNLSNAGAVQHLYQRIVSAAQQVCDERIGLRPLEEQARTRLCVAQSVQRAVAAVNHPALTRFHAEKTGQSSMPSAMLANRH